MKFFTPALFLLVILQSHQVSAQAGSLDLSFNKTGVEKILSINGNAVNGCYATAILPTGKILLVGAADTDIVGSYVNAWAIVRLNKNGKIDSTFGYKGHIICSIAQTDDVANSIVIKNGNFYVAGLTTGPPIQGHSICDMAVAAFKTTGKLPPFGGPPTALVIFDRGQDTTFAVTVQKNGRVIGAGVVQTNSSTQNDFGIFRMYPNAFLDPSFNGTGQLTTDFSGTNDGVYSLDMEGNDIIAAGYTTDGSGKRIPALARYTSAGKLDSTFGTNGKVVVNNESLGPIHSVKALANGKIIATCTIHDLTTNLALIQFKHNGSLDNTFGSHGIARSPFQGIAFSLAVESTGKMIVGGSSGSDFEIARFKSNGTIDSTFGINGEVTTPSMTNIAYSVAIDPDGKYVLAGGYTSGSFEVARYLSGLSLLKSDIELTGNSTLIYPNPIQNTTTLNYTLPKNEAITISLFDITGKLVKQFADNVNKSKGTNQETLNMESVPAGEYILEVKTPSQNIAIKIVKQ